MKSISRRRSRAFTLVEMLAVMTIILVLLGVTLPAMRGYNNAEGRHAAVGALMATMDRARMMAISDGLSTYVVFLAYGSSPAPLQSAATFSPNAFGRAYAIFEDYDNINFKPVQKTPWMYLPPSMAFKVDEAKYNSYANNYSSITNRPLSGSDPSFNVTPNVLAPGVSSSTGYQLPYIKYDSTGVADVTSPNYLRVLMFPGIVTTTGGSGGTEVPTQVAAGSAAQSLLEEIDVNPSTGRANYVVNAGNNLDTTSTSSQ